MPCPFTLVSDHLLKTKEKQKLDTSIKFQIILNEKKNYGVAAVQHKTSTVVAAGCTATTTKKTRSHSEKRKGACFFFCYLRLWL
jgi:hypothetical protein